jgi:hypothetical protein
MVVSRETYKCSQAYAGYFRAAIGNPWSMRYMWAAYRPAFSWAGAHSKDDADRTDLERCLQFVDGRPSPVAAVRLVGS